MKVFLIMWGGLCFLVIVGLIIVYATDQLPGASTPQAEYVQGEILTLTEEECLPCEENLKRLTEAMEAADELQASINAENMSHEKQKEKKAYAEFLEAADELQASINAENMSHEKQKEKKAYAEFLRAFVAYNRNINAENLAYLEQTAKEVQKAFGLWEDANLTEGLSPERFDKAQQLIDQYGTEEGLHRLQKMDPEAARQFERERSPKPPRDVPEREQSER